MSKVYGKVEKLASNSQGHVYAKVSGLNDGDVGTMYTVNLGNGSGVSQGSSVKIEEGDRVSCICKEEGVVFTCTSAPTVYKNRPQNTSGGKSSKNVGIETGHALNGASILACGDIYNSDFQMYAEAVADATSEAKAQHREKFPSLDEYSLGASVGCATLNACRYTVADGMSSSPTKNQLTSDILNTTMNLLESIVPDIEDYIKTK